MSADCLSFYAKELLRDPSSLFLSSATSHSAASTPKAPENVEDLASQEQHGRASVSEERERVIVPAGLGNMDLGNGKYDDDRYSYVSACPTSYLAFQD